MANRNRGWACPKVIGRPVKYLSVQDRKLADFCRLAKQPVGIHRAGTLTGLSESELLKLTRCGKLVTIHGLSKPCFDPVDILRIAMERRAKRLAEAVA